MNGAKEVWLPEDVVEGMCAEHVFGRWMDTHKGEIAGSDAKEKAKARAAMREDFQALKGIPVLGLVDESFDRMMAKWREVCIFLRAYTCAR